MASLAVTDAAKTQFLKLGDKLQSPQSPTAFKNCTHCQGVVHNI